MKHLNKLVKDAIKSGDRDTIEELRYELYMAVDKLDDKLTAMRIAKRHTDPDGRVWEFDDEGTLWEIMNPGARA
jgi:hypothetical protein